MSLTAVIIQIQKNVCVYQFTFLLGFGRQIRTNCVIRSVVVISRTLEPEI